MDPRQQFLEDVLVEFFDQRKTWVESDYRYVTEDLERAADELIEAFSAGTIPGDLRRVEQVVSREFAPAWEAFKRVARATGDVNTLPDDGFWLAVANLEKARAEAEPKPPLSIESIDELTRQGVPDRQICLIYEWVDDRGSPELWRLREERAEPGKHTQFWVSAAERRRQAQEGRQHELRRQIAERQTKKVERLTKPCQETTEELLRQGLAAGQIAEMRKISIEEVLDEADRLNIPRPPVRYASPGGQRAPHDPEPNEAAARIFDANAANSGKRGRGRPPKPRPAPPPFPNQKSSAEEDDDVYDPEEALSTTDLSGGESSDESGEAPETEGDSTAAADLPLGAMTLEDEILTYHRQGLDPEAIAAAASSPNAKVTVRKVNAVIRRLAEAAR